MPKILAYILILGILFTSCQSRTVKPATATPLPAENGTATETMVSNALETEEAEIELTLGARAKTTSSTPAPTITSTPTPTPTQPAPTSLATNGPWYLFSQMYQGYEIHYKSVVLSDFDGSKQTIPALPAIPRKEIQWAFNFASSGGLIAFRTRPDDYYPFFVQPNGVDDHIFIIKLPENSVVAKLPLLGEAAWEQAQNDLAGKTISSTTLGVIGDPSSFRWSPDGRYLVYSAAVEGIGADLYRYDAQTGEVERLTDGQQNSMIWEWMPDGNGFLYRDVLTYALDFPDFHNIFSGAYLFTDSAGPKLLYVPQGGEVIQWIGKTSGLVYQVGLEAYTCNLRELNIADGRSTELYKECFTGVKVVPNTRSILLTLSTNVYLMFEDSGVFLVNMDTKHKEKVISCTFCSTKWVGSEKQMLIEQRDWDATEVRLIFYTQEGQEVRRIEQSSSGSINVSPDEQWAVTDWERLRIIRLTDLEQYEIDSLGEEVERIWWDEDQTAFTSLQTSCPDMNGTCIIRYTEAEEWEPELIFGIANVYDRVYVIHP